VILPPRFLQMCCKLLGKMVSTAAAEVTVVFCKDGVEAVSQFLQHQPGQILCIFMDINMPRLSGFEATKQIRALEALSLNRVSVPIIACSSDNTNAMQALKSGMDCFAPKPITTKFVKQQIAYAKTRQTSGQNAPHGLASSFGATLFDEDEQMKDLRLLHKLHQSQDQLNEESSGIPRRMSVGDIRHDGERIRSFLPGIKHLANVLQNAWEMFLRKKDLQYRKHRTSSSKVSGCNCEKDLMIERAPRSFPGPQLTRRASLACFCIACGEGGNVARYHSSQIP